MGASIEKKWLNEPDLRQYFYLRTFEPKDIISIERSRPEIDHGDKHPDPGLVGLLLLYDLGHRPQPAGHPLTQIGIHLSTKDGRRRLNEEEIKNDDSDDVERAGGASV